MRSKGLLVEGSAGTGYPVQCGAIYRVQLPVGASATSRVQRCWQSDFVVKKRCTRWQRQAQLVPLQCCSVETHACDAVQQTVRCRRLARSVCRTKWRRKGLTLVPADTLGCMQSTATLSVHLERASVLVSCTKYFHNRTQRSNCLQHNCRRRVSAEAGCGARALSYVRYHTRWPDFQSAIAQQQEGRQS